MVRPADSRCRRKPYHVFGSAILSATFVLLLLVLTSGCSTTKHLGSGEDPIDSAVLDTVSYPAVSGPEVKGEVVELPLTKIPADTLLFSEKVRNPIQENFEVHPLGTGHASYYGNRFAGRPTASGERFDPNELTAAHRTLPFGSLVRVTNVDNGKSIVVRINDRGPSILRRIIDLSYAAAKAIGMIPAGLATVKLELLKETGENDS